MSKNRINSRQKGARVEREAAAFLTSIGFPAERMARIGKSADDLLCPCLPGVHLECKADGGHAVGSKVLADSYQQASDNCAGREPFVLWKIKRRGWFLTWAERWGALVTCGESDIVNVLSKFHVSANPPGGAGEGDK